MVLAKTTKKGIFEGIFSSKSRAKIIRILAIKNELNISKIISLTGISHSCAENHLNYLKKISFIKEKRFGRIRIFQFQEENIKARALKNLIFFWEQNHVE